MVSGVLLLSLMLFLSCVDIPNKEPAIPDPVGAYRFIHAATDLGDVGIKIDGVSKGNLAFKGILNHDWYPAGTRQVLLSNGDTLLVSVATEMRGTFCILDKEKDARAFIRLQERRTFDSATLGEKGAVRVVHLCPDGPSLTFSVAGAETVDLGSLAYKGVGSYKTVTPGNYNLVGKDGNNTLVDWPITVGNTRMTVLIVGKAASLSVMPLNDN